MHNFKTILKFAKPYLKFAYLNVIFNILYAIFNVLSVLAFVPVLGILFGTDQKITKAPVYEGITSLGTFLKESFYFYISTRIDNDGAISVLLFICLLTFSLFFFLLH